MKGNQQNYTATRNARLKKEAQEKEEKGLFHWGERCPITGMPMKDMDIKKKEEYWGAFTRKKAKKQELQ